MKDSDSEYSLGDVETSEEGDIIGHGRSAHYLHRKAEDYGVSRIKVATTYNRMESMINPEEVDYEPTTNVRPDFPKDGELKEAAEILSREESIENSATKAVRDHLLRKKTGKLEMRH